LKKERRARTALELQPRSGGGSPRKRWPRQKRSRRARSGAEEIAGLRGSKTRAGLLQEAERS